MAKPRIAPLDPAQHCRHATHDKPLVRACWNRDRGNPCQFCAAVERENRERAEAREKLLATETYYEHIRRTERSSEKVGTLALWAADLYEQAGADVERAVGLIADSGAYSDDAPIIACHLRLMPERNQGGIGRWPELLRAEGVA